MTKPDCTGQRFDRLTVLGKGGKRLRKRRSKTDTFQQLWRLQCDCGNVIELLRNDFVRNKRKSCGCKARLGLVDYNRRPTDITGRRFGQLTAIKLTGSKDKHRHPTWLLNCTCGNTRELSLSWLGTIQRSNVRINCGDKSKHPENYLNYPLAPNPYPKQASELLVKYLKETELSFCNKIDSAIEDEKRDSLLRAAWIITYRRSQGEFISEEFERGIIKKYMRYAANTVQRKRYFEAIGYAINRKYKEIGSTMTELISSNDPVIETQGKIRRATKRFKFKKY